MLLDDFCNALYGDSKYFEPKGTGDHLAHTVTLRSVSQLHRYGYWRFSEYLLDPMLSMPSVVKPSSHLRISRQYRTQKKFRNSERNYAAPVAGHAK